MYTDKDDFFCVQKTNCVNKGFKKIPKNILQQLQQQLTKQVKRFLENVKLKLQQLKMFSQNLLELEIFKLSHRKPLLNH